MGTRNLTMVVSNDEYKVAQYGQWDGYPDGNGVVILDFLKQMDKNHFKENLKLVRFMNDDDRAEVDEFFASIGIKDGLMNMEQKNRYDDKYPLLSRDVGASILSEINKITDPVFIMDSIEFANDSLFCEWAYLVNFDTNKLEVYQGYNKEPLKSGERFYNGGLSDNNEYHPIRLVKDYDLDDLPEKEQFLLDLKPK